MAEEPLITVYVQVRKSINGIPGLELRRVIPRNKYDTDIIRKIVYCAWHDKPMILNLKFKDKLRSTSDLLETGFIYKKKKNDYRIL